MALVMSGCGGGASSPAGEDPQGPASDTAPVTVGQLPSPSTWLSCPSAAAVTVGEQVSLTCEKAVANLPMEGKWVPVSAPQGASLSVQPGFTLSFLARHAGAYRFEFQASSGGFHTARTLDLTALAPPNQPPSLSCPTELSSPIHGEAVIACTAQDDGQPAGSVLQPSWSVVSAPAKPTLGDEGLKVRFTPGSAGVYRLRLSVSDGAAVTSADVNVNVAPQPNRLPQVRCPAALTSDAGREVSVACSADDDGLPTGSRLSYRWTLVSAPAAVVLSGQTTPEARFLPEVAGVYRLRLAVSDGEAVTESESSVTVGPPPNLAPRVNCPQTVNGRAQQEVAVSCTASDDGRPSGAALIPRWTVVSGPATPVLDGASSYSVRFVPSAAGTYRLRLDVSDGALTTPSEITVAVGLPVNQAPGVICPAALSGRTGQEVVLSCTASDDGLPQGSALSLAWTVLASPAPVSLSAPGASTTRFVPSAAGTYKLRLTAGDSELNSTSDVTVTVAAPPNLAPVVQCPAAPKGQARQEVVISCTATDDGQPGGASLSAAWTVVSAPEAVVLGGQQTLGVRFTPTIAGTYRLRLNVSDSALSSPVEVAVAVTAPQNGAPVVACPASLNGSIGQKVTLACTASDDGQPSPAKLTPSWTVVASPAAVNLSGQGTLSAGFTPNVPGTYRLRLRVGDGALATDAESVVTVTNAAPKLSCPTVVTGQAKQELAFACTVTDSDIPTGAALTGSWVQVSGPASLALVAAGTAGSSLKFVPQVAGTYSLRLSVTDSLLSSSATVAVTISPAPNVAPTVNCPATLSATVNQQAAITCTATDDGQPAGVALAPSWTFVSGPATPVLTGQNSFNLRFVPAVAGAYRMRLAVSDSKLSAATEVVVNVAAPANTAPKVTCPTQTAGRVNREVSISCTVSDDGLPAGGTLSRTWSWVTGPAAPSLIGQGTPAIRFTALVPGTYWLRLTASDGLLATAADIEVTVAPAPFVRIQPLGASIVQGYGGAQSFRYRLWKKLIDANASFDMVGTMTATASGTPTYPDYLGRAFDRHHEGRSGWTTGQLAAGLPGWLASYSPTMSLIHVGTNDMLLYGSSGIQGALDGLTSIVQSLRAKNPDVKIYVAQLIPIAPAHPAAAGQSLDGAAAAIVALNSRLPAWGAGLSTTRSPVRVVDHFTGFNGLTQTFDGIHPNESGEELMAQRWLNAIQDGL